MNSGVRALARIVVIGSVAGDEVVRLTTPLGAGAHLNGSRAGARLGGGGANTAVALAAAGHQVALLPAVGHYAIGDALLKELELAGVDTAQIVRLAGASTHSLVLVDPQGERTVVNAARCAAAGPPPRCLWPMCRRSMRLHGRCRCWSHPHPPPTWTAR